MMKRTKLLGRLFPLTLLFSLSIQAQTETKQTQPTVATADALYSTAAKESDAGHYQAAVASLQQAVRLRPDWAEAHFNLCQANVRAGYVSEAVAACKRALGLNEKYGAAYFLLGKIYQRMGHA